MGGSIIKKIITFFILIKSISSFEINSAQNPGIIFEQQKDIKTMEEKWRLIIAIDFKPEKFNLTQVMPQFDELPISCVLPDKNCTYFLNKYLDINTKSENVEHYWNVLQECFSKQKITMNEEELKLSHEQIKTFRENDKKMIFNTTTKTIFVESNLTQTTPKMKKHYKTLLEKLEIARNLTIIRYKLDFETLFNSYNHAFKIMKVKLNKYTERAHSIEDSLNLLAVGKLSADLLCNNTVKEILRKLQERNSALEIPLSKNITTIKELEEISEIGFGTINEYAFITIDIPLVKIKPIIAYKIHTFPVPQE